jgi:hypothetical protein
MRNIEQVYLVGMDEFGSYNGSTTVTMRLLKGNEVLEVDDVLYVETDADSLAGAWEENVDMMDEVGDGVRLETVTDEEADRLYALRMGEDVAA